MPMKAATAKTPAAGSAVPNNAAAPKGAAAHTETAKTGKPEARKDAQGRQEGKEGKHEREGQ
jgi:hypothetical protein